MMRHLIHFTDGRIQPLWAPGTPFRERFRLARAFRAFAEGLDPRDREGFFRFDVDADGNAMVGGRATYQYPSVGMGESEVVRVQKWSYPDPEKFLEGWR